KKGAVYLETFAQTVSEIRQKSIVNITATAYSGFSGEIKYLAEDVKDSLDKGNSVIIFAGTEKSARNLALDLEKEGISAHFVDEVKSELSKGVLVLKGTISGGFEYQNAGISVFTHAKTFNLSKKAKKRKKSDEMIRSLADLSVGDFVVHISHGIGVFDGIQKLEIQGVIKDYIKIKYAKGDTLYVPVTQLDLVSKYIGSRDDSSVKLSRLNSTEWSNTKARVKKEVADMADELIKLYAERAKAKGFAFSEDTDWQKNFEEHFDYEETDDQLRCIAEIKADMEKPQPMERLLCGDVGFGKTEVALRGAFKCVMDSKQCAILVPTTILAWQHYQTALARFGNFPVKIELLSRFRTPKQQKEILKQLQRGEIDIIIGTHRLVQDDVAFKDLGLVIIDEEQRFGVKHKEKFKESFRGVDILTLSATPIPRTLNMAMSGIRDMSVIEEAPQNRHPVQTYVLEQDMGIVAEAIKKELRRGGQVYYLHNKVETIEHTALKLRALIPDLRVEVAHGKMSEEALSRVWKRLIEGEIDVLCSTTIIETGVDVPNVNTLIIENADNLGLSQLYQLRGRVGRSSRRAFAYFMFTRGKVLTEVATKRLTAIREFTKFGSGFNIAMRDLEIRGAGNILGAKQHGHMEAVGYDMYLRLLSEAVSEKKGEATSSKSYECLVDISINAHIPETYIENLSQRLDVYRKIASIKTSTDAEDVIDELIDRFGEAPPSVFGLIDVAVTRNMAALLGIYEIKEQAGSLLFYFEKLDIKKASVLASQMQGRVLVNASEKPYISVRIQKGEKTQDLMKKVITNLSSIE
ncbi:MAG: transcription-repair coupling factor, partial [Oscillospiraceae bacterium]|nr:transcription-repair coupling factor [Oscillospiraceae bacterium]